MNSITSVPCRCACGWKGTVYDCEPDVDGDGSLGCPECQRVVSVLTVGANQYVCANCLKIFDLPAAYCGVEPPVGFKMGGYYCSYCLHGQGGEITDKEKITFLASKLAEQKGTTARWKARTLFWAVIAMLLYEPAVEQSARADKEG